MLKTVLIGAGGIAWKHCEALRKLGVEISGIYDVNPVNAGRLAEAFGCPVVSDPVHAIAGADMVHILTPPSKRWEYVECALAYKKHIFMEKPVAISLEDAQRMELAAKAVPVQFMVGFTQRFRKGYRIIREWLDQGRAGGCGSGILLPDRSGSGIWWKAERQLEDGRRLCLRNDY